MHYYTACCSAPLACCSKASPDSGFNKNLHQFCGAYRRIAGWFEYNRITAYKGREYLPRRYGKGKVPRRNQGKDTYWHTDRFTVLIGKFRGHSLASEPPAFAPHVVGHVYGLLHIAKAFRQDLAHLAGYKPAKLLFPLTEEFRCLQDYLAPSWGRSKPPFVIGIACRCYSHVYVLLP